MFSPGVPRQAPWAASSLSRELSSPRLTRRDGSSWSQAIIINAMSFPFLSGFQTHAQAPASSYQPPSPRCQRNSSKQGEGLRGLPGDRGKKLSTLGKKFWEKNWSSGFLFQMPEQPGRAACITPGAGKCDAWGLGSCQAASLWSAPLLPPPLTKPSKLAVGLSTGESRNCKHAVMCGQTTFTLSFLLCKMACMPWLSEACVLLPPPLQACLETTWDCKSWTNPLVQPTTMQGQALPGQTGTAASPPTSKMGLKFALSTTRLSAFCGRFAVLSRCLLAKPKGCGAARAVSNVSHGCAGCAPHHSSELLPPRGVNFGLSVQREDLWHTRGLPQSSRMCPPVFSIFTFLPPVLRDRAVNSKGHSTEGFICEGSKRNWSRYYVLPLYC